MPPDFEEEESATLQAEEEAADGDDDEDEACDDACCDEEDPLGEPRGAAVTGNEEELDSISVPAEDQLEQSESDTGGPKNVPKKKKQKTQKASEAASSRLEQLSKPKPAKEEPIASSPAPVKREETKKKKDRPSLLLRLRPNNIEECWAAFEASGFQVAPKFTYNHPDEIVTKYFEENNNVCFELLPEAKRILQKVQDEYGGAEAFMAQLYGDRKIPAEEMRDIVLQYLKDHNIEDKVEIRLVDNMLAAANVVKNTDQPYIVNIANGPISCSMVQGICDHEVGTHLLRMMNDEHQVWHGIRDRYKLANPWTTEEGFATLNTYQSMPCGLMYPQALRYFAVCRGAQCGFVELFHELMGHMSEPKRCWQMCCRIKRGMIDTTLPGAFYLDQAYFKGAVEILRHLDEVDFGRLYGGQIALQDLHKVHFLLRKEVVRLPKFLNSAETLKTYKAHCRRLIKENCIETATDSVCKPMFIRTSKEFFKPEKQKVKMNATISIGEGGVNVRSASVGAAKAMDAERLADLARPRQVIVTADAEEEVAATSAMKLRDFDRTRVIELALPRPRAVSEAPSENRCSTMSRSLDLSRLEAMAKPRSVQLEIESESTDQKREVERKSLDPRRLLELALPRKVEVEETAPAPSHARKPKGSRKRASRARKRSSSLAGIAQQDALDDVVDATEMDDEDDRLDDVVDEVPPPPPPFSDTPRSVNSARLVELGTPRKRCEEDKSVPCKCPPKGGRARKRRSKLRILAMVQDREQKAAEEEEEEEDDDDDDALQQDVPQGPALEKALSEGHLPEVEATFDSLDEHLRQSQKRADADAVFSSPGSVHSIGLAERAEAGYVKTPLELVEFSVPRMSTQSPAAMPRPASDDVKKALDFSALPGVSTLWSVPVLRPTSEEVPSAEQRAERRPELKPRGRAVARARSLGPGGAGGHGGVGGGLGARSSLPFDELELGGCARRPRLPIGLPRGIAAAVAAGHGGPGGGGGSMAVAGGGGPMWKAVPIKVMQFDFCGL